MTTVKKLVKTMKTKVRVKRTLPVARIRQLRRRNHVHQDTYKDIYQEISHHHPKGLCFLNYKG
jgi:hypothetical protein